MLKKEFSSNRDVLLLINSDLCQSLKMFLTLVFGSEKCWIQAF